MREKSSSRATDSYCHHHVAIWLGWRSSPHLHLEWFGHLYLLLLHQGDGFHCQIHLLLDLPQITPVGVWPSSLATIASQSQSREGLHYRLLPHAHLLDEISCLWSGLVWCCCTDFSSKWIQSNPTERVMRRTMRIHECDTDVISQAMSQQLHSQVHTWNDVDYQFHSMIIVGYNPRGMENSSEVEEE
jgi:hypothetical protein